MHCRFEAITKMKGKKRISINELRKESLIEAAAGLALEVVQDFALSVIEEMATCITQTMNELVAQVSVRELKMRTCTNLIKLNT